MDIVVPKVGLTVEVVEVLHWHAEAGEEVRSGDPLVALAADKVDLDIEAPTDGVLTEILAAPGAEVRPGEVIGRIGDVEATSREERPAAAANAGRAEPDAAGVDVGLAEYSGGAVLATPVARRAADALGVDLHMVKGSGTGGRVRRRDVESAANGDERRFPGGAKPSSPAARRLATELGVALDAAIGTGPRGRIVEADIRRATKSRPEQALPARPLMPAAPANADLAPVRWTAARRLTARRMSESVASVAPVTLHRRADAGAAMAAARALKQDGVRATFTHIVLACTAASLRQHPEVNSVWEGDELMRSKVIHLGLAVDIQDGLVVPVIHEADKLSVTDLATIAAGLVAQCRAGSLAPESLRGSTFSVSNLGMLGVEQFTPIINPPHVAILGVGTAVDEALPSADGVRFRKACHLSLTFDHRALDGAPAARFLDAVVARLETFKV